MAEDAGSHTRGPASALGSGFTFDSPRGSHFPWEAIQLAPDLGLLVETWNSGRRWPGEETFLGFVVWFLVFLLA